MSSQIHVLLVVLSMVGPALGFVPFQAATPPGDRVGGGAAGNNAVYGDITSAAGVCIPDGNCLASDVDFDDVLCALNGFALPAACPCADIAGAVEMPCIPDGELNFDDILAVLESFAGNFTCNPQPGECAETCGDGIVDPGEECGEPGLDCLPGETCVDCICEGVAACQPTGAPNDCCADSLEIFDGTTIFDTTGANTDGNIHVACDFDGQTYHDLWYNYVATCDGDVPVSTCNAAGYDTDLVVYFGGSEICTPGDAELVGCNDDDPACSSGFRSTVVVPDVTIGTVLKIRVGGRNDGDQGWGTLTISCGLGDCCEQHATPDCDDADCCDCVCANDPFCCASSWDEGCVFKACFLCSTVCVCCDEFVCGNGNADPGEQCGEPGLFCFYTDCVDCICVFPQCPGSGSCCYPNGTPGCEDEDCCNAVCNEDEFCCNDIWDGTCASFVSHHCNLEIPCGHCGNGNAEPGEECGEPGLDCPSPLETCEFCQCVPVCPGPGDCCEPNGTPGCNDADCCDCVCANDPFCCDTEWDQPCAAATCCGSCDNACGSLCLMGNCIFRCQEPAPIIDPGREEAGRAVAEPAPAPRDEPAAPSGGVDPSAAKKSGGE